jgi:hypothetical protein
MASFTDLAPKPLLAAISDVKVEGKVFSLVASTEPALDWGKTT